MVNYLLTETKYKCIQIIVNQCIIGEGGGQRRFLVISFYKFAHCDEVIGVCDEVIHGSRWLMGGPWLLRRGSRVQPGHVTGREGDGQAVTVCGELPVVVDGRFHRPI